MYKYIINGGYKLHGETFVSGSKNASLPILAATVISGKTTRLYNVPDIEDVKITLEILKEIGCKVKKDKKEKKEKKKKNKKEGYFAKVGRELKKVVWPSFANVAKYSLAVLIFGLLFCGFFIGVDALASLVKGLFS